MDQAERLSGQQEKIMCKVYAPNTMTRMYQISEGDYTKIISVYL